MSFDRWIQGRLDSAERAEIIDTDERFVADLRNVLDETALTQGVRIEIGDDEQSLQRVIDLLDIEKATGTNKYFNIVKGVVGMGSSAQHMSHERMSPLVEKHGPIRALEVMQAEAWKVTEKLGYLKSIVPADEKATSEILLLHAVEEEGEQVLGPDSLGITLGLHCRYQPESFNEYDYDSLAYMLEAIEANKNPYTRVAALADKLDQIEADLVLPGKSFYISIGKEFTKDSTPFFGGTPVSVFPHHGSYRVTGGRVVLKGEANIDNGSEGWNEDAWQAQNSKSSTR